MKPLIIGLFIICSFYSCKTYIQQTEVVRATPENSASFGIQAQTSEYRASVPKIFELIHTSLDLSFDIPEKKLYGKAEITLKPHFYATDSLVLDARGFQIKEVSFISKEKKTALKFSYSSPQLFINLEKKYTSKDTLRIFIEYSAQPDKLPTRSKSWAVSDDRGLYFIDAETDSPQIWTQGETSSNSCWFPTLDAPNQKMTQEIKITVPHDLKTLSNGLLAASLLNENGTRTDLWRQSLPHAPYLAMIAVGKFEILEYWWRKIPVSVYIPEGKAKEGRETFGKTSEMIDFFSRKFKVDYPWEKYDQIVVRQFVSGAMENTTATVFGDFILKIDSEDWTKYNESVVAHELSHHWFGDLVTCESWANTALNEAFATYSEYLWFEYKYGREEADFHLSQDYYMFLSEYSYKNEDLIRFHYREEGDVFDMHSYQKGALILHMLRKTVGDAAFFESLKLYLKKFRFSSAEVHDLRLVLEETTGEDMNWFFNQWFLDKGLPDLKLDYSYDQNTQTASVKVEQIQNPEANPLYTFPLQLGFYLSDTIIVRKVKVEGKAQEFRFKIQSRPKFIDFDTENGLLCQFSENKTKDEYLAQLDLSPDFSDKIAAFQALTPYFKDADVQEALLKLTNHQFWYYRYLVCGYFPVKAKKDIKKRFTARLLELSEQDPNKFVRRAANRRLEEK